MSKTKGADAPERDIPFNDMRGLSFETARRAAAAASPDLDEEQIQKIVMGAVFETFGQVPELSWCPGSIEPGERTQGEVGVQVSLHGRLLQIRQDKTPEGDWARTEERYGLNWSEFDGLMGRLLTLCDASFSDPEQRKAFKDMVRNSIKQWVADCIVNAAADAGIERNITAPFVGGVFDRPGMRGEDGSPDIG